MFWCGSGLAWCNSNMVLWTMDWNAKLQRFGSSYIRPWSCREQKKKKKSTSFPSGKNILYFHNGIITHQEVVAAHVLPLVHRFPGQEHVRTVGKMFQERGLAAAHVAFYENSVRRSAATTLMIVYGHCYYYSLFNFRRNSSKSPQTTFIQRQRQRRTGRTPQTRRWRGETKQWRQTTTAMQRQRPHRFLTAKTRFLRLKCLSTRTIIIARQPNEIREMRIWMHRCKSMYSPCTCVQVLLSTLSRARVGMSIVDAPTP